MFKKCLLRLNRQQAHHLKSSVNSGWKAVANRFFERTATATFSNPSLADFSLGVNLHIEQGTKLGLRYKLA